MVDNVVALWDRASRVLRDGCGVEMWEMWLERTVGLYIDGCCLVVACDSKFAGGWLTDHYMAAALGAVRREWPECEGLRWSVDPAAVALAIASASVVAAPVPKSERKARARVVSAPVDARYTFNRFVVGEGNRYAYAAMVAIAAGGGTVYNPVYLYGSTGVGKTHLMQSLEADFKKKRPSSVVVSVSADDFCNDLVSAINKHTTEKFRMRYARADLLLVDDVQFLGGKRATQSEFFGLFNRLVAVGCRVVMSAERRPEEIDGLDDRLRSRLAGGLVVEIQTPDLDTRRGILELRAAEECAMVSHDVIDWIATHAWANVRVLEGALLSLIGYCRLDGRPVTVDVARSILRDLVPEEVVSSLIVDDVLRAVAGAYGLKVSDLTGKARGRRYSVPRQVAMAVTMDLVAGSSLASVGRAFGGRDHTTVLYAVRAVRRLLAKDEFCKSTVARITRALGG
jgi:chromosomal replication initiator protein